MIKVHHLYLSETFRCKAEYTKSKHKFFDESKKHIMYKLFFLSAVRKSKISCPVRYNH